MLAIYAAFIGATGFHVRPSALVAEAGREWETAPVSTVPLRA